VYTNPRVLATLRAEIAATGAPHPISSATAAKLPYLQAVIRESLRMTPPITGLLLKDAPPEGDHFKGRFIPGGTAIGYCAMGLFRDPAIWGEDVDSFRPERFLEGTAAELREREAAYDMMFSYGKWSCLGRTIAMQELNKVVVGVSTCSTMHPCERQ
jgi:cytochrome P450